MKIDADELQNLLMRKFERIQREQWGCLYRNTNYYKERTGQLRFIAELSEDIVNMVKAEKKKEVQDEK